MDGRVTLALVALVLGLVLGAGFVGYYNGGELAGVVAFILIAVGVVWWWVRREA